MLTDWPDIPEPGNEPVKDGDHRIVLEAQVVDLHLLFERDKTEVVVVIPDPELLALRDAVDLFPQCLVRNATYSPYGISNLSSCR